MSHNNNISSSALPRFTYLIERYKYGEGIRYRLLFCNTVPIHGNKCIMRIKARSYNHKDKTILHQLARKWYPDAIYLNNIKPNVAYLRTTLYRRMNQLYAD